MIAPRFLGIAILGLSVLLGSCKSDTTSSNTPNTAVTNTMSVSVGGAMYTMHDTIWRTSSNGHAALMVTGLDSSGGGRSCTMTLVNVKAAGSYDIGIPTLPTTPYALMTYSYSDGNGTLQSYGMPVASGPAASNVTITEFDSTTLAGTFTATLTRQSGASGPATQSLNNGSFRVSMH